MVITCFYKNISLLQKEQPLPHDTRILLCFFQLMAATLFSVLAFLARLQVDEHHNLPSASRFHLHPWQ